MGYSLKYEIRLDKIKLNGECPIVIRVTIYRQSFRHPIGENILPKNWNKKDETPKKGSPNRAIIISKLETEKQRIENLISKYYFNNNNKYPKIQDLKILLKSESKTKSDKKTIIEYFEEFVEEYSKKKGLQYGTVRVYRNTIYRLKEFFKANKIDPSWETFNEDFYHDFVDFYLDEGRNTEGTIGKYIKNIKTFLKYIYKKYKLISPEQFDGFHVMKGKSDFVILSKIDLLMYRPLNFWTEWG